MSDSKTGSLVGLWCLAFIVGKLAGPLVAWSWWWIFLPAIPTLVEIVKAVLR